MGNTFGIILALIVVGAGCYFAYWATKQVLSDKTGKNRRSRRANRR